MRDNPSRTTAPAGSPRVSPVLLIPKRRALQTAMASFGPQGLLPWIGYLLACVIADTIDTAMSFFYLHTRSEAEIIVSLLYAIYEYLHMTYSLCLM